MALHLKSRLAPPLSSTEKGSDLASHNNLRTVTARLAGLRKRAEAALAEGRAAEVKARRDHDAEILGPTGLKQALEAARQRAIKELREVREQASNLAEVMGTSYQRHWNPHAFFARQKVTSGQSKAEMVALFKNLDPESLAARAQVAVDDKDLGTLDALLLARPDWRGDVLGALRGQMLEFDQMRAAAASAELSFAAITEATERAQRGELDPPKTLHVAFSEAGVRERFDVSVGEVEEVAGAWDAGTLLEHEAADKRLLAAQAALEDLTPESEPTGSARLAGAMKVAS